MVASNKFLYQVAKGLSRNGWAIAIFASEDGFVVVKGNRSSLRDEHRQEYQRRLRVPRDKLSRRHKVRLAPRELRQRVAAITQSLTRVSQPRISRQSRRKVDLFGVNFPRKFPKQRRSRRDTTTGGLRKLSFRCEFFHRVSQRENGDNVAAPTLLLPPLGASSAEFFSSSIASMRTWERRFTVKPVRLILTR